MRKSGAILLSFVILLLSTKSGIGFHFCHDALVETTLNHLPSSCCDNKSENKQPTLKSHCCEIDYIDISFDDTFLKTDVVFSSSVHLQPKDNAVLFDVFIDSKQDKRFWKHPPDPPPSSISLHILFEQYLI